MTDSRERIVFFKGHSQYDAVCHLLDDLAQAFYQLGYAPEIIPLEEATLLNQLKTVLQAGNIKLFIGLNGWGMPLQLAGRSLYDQLNIPFLAYFVDHPVHNIPRFDIAIDKLAYAFVDETHLDFFRQYISPPNPAGFIPHGGWAHHASLTPFQDRPHDLVFVGTLGDPEAMAPELTFSDPLLTRVVWGTLEACLPQNTPDFTHQFLTACLQENFDLSRLSTPQTFDILGKIERYVRVKRRLNLLASIQSFPLTLYTNDPNAARLKNPRLTVHPAIPYRELVNLFDQSKLVLHTSPFISAGGHDRLFYAMLQGAACLSDTNPWLQAQYHHGQHLYYYDLGAPNLDDLLYTIAQDPDTWASVAEAGCIRTQQAHTWLHRAQAILTLMETATGLSNVHA